MRELRFTGRVREAIERLVTALCGAFLLGVFVYIQIEVWPRMLGGGA